MRISMGLAVSALLVAPASLSAQNPPPVPIMPANSSKPPPPNPAFDQLAAKALAQDSGISEDEAARQLNLDDDISAFVERLDSANLPEFAGVYLDRNPAFQLTVLHTGPRDAFERKIALPNLFGKQSEVR